MASGASGSLADLRRARGMTQAQVAEALGVSKARVSDIERGADLRYSTLRRYVEAVGGRLEVVAVLDDEERVDLSSSASSPGHVKPIA